MSNFCQKNGENKSLPQNQVGEIPVKGPGRARGLLAGNWSYDML